MLFPCTKPPVMHHCVCPATALRNYSLARRVNDHDYRRSYLASHQVDDSALASVPNRPPGGRKVKGHWHLDETKWEHGGDDT